MHTPEPSYRQTLREVAADMAGVRDTLVEVHGRLTMQVDGQPIRMELEGFRQVPIPGLEGMHWALLPPTTMPQGSYSHMFVCGKEGIHFPRTSLPHALRVHLLRGALLWTQASQGSEPRRVEAGEQLEVAANEEHGYQILEDYTAYVTFTPPL